MVKIRGPQSRIRGGRGLAPGLVGGFQTCERVLTTALEVGELDLGVAVAPHRPLEAFDLDRSAVRRRDSASDISRQSGIIRRNSHFDVQVVPPGDALTASAKPTCVILYKQYAGSGAYSQAHNKFGGRVAGVSELHPTKRQCLIAAFPAARVDGDARTVPPVADVLTSEPSL